MLAVAVEGRALDPGRFAALEPELTGFGHGNRSAVGGVDACADIDGDLSVTRLGIALALEGLQVTFAELIGVVDDEG